MTTTVQRANRRKSIAIREQRPFARLEPRRIPIALSSSAKAGLSLLEQFVQPHTPTLLRAFVNYTITRGSQSRTGYVVAQPASVLNRRRRASLEWIQAILAGQIDRNTLHTVANSWVPQLAGTGPELHRCAAHARDFVEYLRGAMTALVLDDPQANLVPEAKALHALETILSVHLRAVQDAQAAAKTPAF